MSHIFMSSIFCVMISQRITSLCGNAFCVELNLIAGKTDTRFLNSSIPARVLMAPQLVFDIKSTKNNVIYTYICQYL
jgi:hypothetical protein